MAFRLEWERQLWHLALKTDKPLEAYRDMMDSVAKSSQTDQTLDELPKQRLNWLRAT